jgi:hypothetical protein
MKTFKQFLLEVNTSEQLLKAALKAANRHRNDPEKRILYVELVKKVRARLNPDDEEYFGRAAARRDKHLYPSDRMSSHPGEENPSTLTKNPKKLRKQRALGEIS